MTPFEIIILIVLYLFALGYIATSFDIFNERNTWRKELFILIVAGTIGVLNFPLVFAGDIWTKLNKEEQQ
jgi:hypothetical protein